jgi:hypothetical protein
MEAGHSKQFEIGTSLLPRYFYIQFEGDVEQVQLVLEGTNEKLASENYYYVQAERARMLYWFKDGGQVSWFFFFGAQKGSIQDSYNTGRVDWSVKCSFHGREDRNSSI